MSFQPMSLGVSYSKNQVLELMREHEPAAERYICCAKAWIGLVAFTEHMDKCHPDGLPEHEIPVPLTGTEREAEDAALDLELAEIEADTIPEITRTIIQYPLPPSNSDKANTPVEELPDPTDFNLADFIHSPIKSPYMAERPAPQTSSSSSTPPDGSLATPTTSTQHSPVQGGPLLKNGVQRNFLTAPNQYLPSVQQQTRFDRAFNDVVIGNAVDNKPSKLPTHIAPGLLGGSTAKNLGIPTVPPTGPGGQPTVQQEGEASKEPVLPEPSLFATTKPWRCPNPGCNKAYKQSNGLKYHQSKGYVVHHVEPLISSCLPLANATLPSMKLSILVYRSKRLKRGTGHSFVPSELDARSDTGR
jgi:transcription factor SFP1